MISLDTISTFTSLTVKPCYKTNTLEHAPFDHTNRFFLLTISVFCCNFGLLVYLEICFCVSLRYAGLTVLKITKVEFWHSSKAGGITKKQQKLICLFVCSFACLEFCKKMFLHLQRCCYCGCDVSSRMLEIPTQSFVK